MNIYPEDKLSKYTVQLPRPMELDLTNWEVRLSEIHFPNMFCIPNIFYAIGEDRNRNRLSKNILISMKIS